MSRYASMIGAALVLLPAACSSSSAGTPVTVPRHSTSAASTTSPARVSTSSARRSPSPSPSTKPASAAQRVLEGMSEAERVGQLLMVDCPSTGVADATVTAIRLENVGSVILDGNSHLSVSATKAVTDQLQGYAPGKVGLFVSTDQEGGLVRRMQGPGFDDIPSAVQQGTEDPATLRSDAQRWGGQLAAAGIDVDLAPVLDTVPPGTRSNPPIGDLDREYGRTPAAVASHGVAVAQGLAAGGVDATVKHFPGLGRVTGNTDTSSRVTDSVTTTNDPYFAPFQAAIAAGVPFVMMSTAMYSKLDPGTPAAFSAAIVTGILRDDLGFHGVVISDDLGAAKQVSGYSVGERAVDFVAAGGDIALTVVASQAEAMAQALLTKSQQDPSFKAKVDAAALRVLQAKQARGLLSS